MERPLISVVTVAWNLIEAGRRDSIHEAVACVQAQSCREIEHVIWDGASSDGTQELLAELAEKVNAAPDAIPLVYHSERDAGLYDAMNKAVALCRGDYVIFLNSDDSLAGEDVLEQLAEIARWERPDFIYGGTLQSLPDGSVKDHRRTNLRAFLQRMPFCHNSMLVRRDVFDGLGGHDLSFRVASDYDFVFRMLVAGRTGRNAAIPVSKYAGRGVSGDTRGVGQDYARVWNGYFGALTGVGSYDPETCLHWYRIGQLPVSCCLAAWRAGAGIPLLRQAARHSLKITLRRKLQPWRSWDNLKGA